MSSGSRAPGPPPGFSRRRALLGGAALLGGTAAGTLPAGRAIASDASAPSDRPAVGSDTLSFSGPHQAGIASPPQAFANFTAYDLTVRDPRRVTGLLRILTDDIRRMTSGRPALGDTAPELAAVPARLTVTVGFGPGLFSKTGTGGRQPAGLTRLPAFPAIDRLDPAYGGGDLLLHIAADDPIIVAHAQRMLTKDLRALASVRWCQRGFLHARGAIPGGTTQRNLMGQLDGTVNPGGAELDDVVWAGADAGWFAGGTTLVIRRIRMDLDRWDELDPSAMDATIGRRQSDGAPLSGSRERDEPDFAVTDATGLPAIAEFAHIRVARGDGPARQILRRPYNYDDSPGPGGRSDSGQIFCSYQSDIAAQFVPIQERLAADDLFNQWVTPVGSAVFAVPPGCGSDGYLGEGLFA